MKNYTNEDVIEAVRLSWSYAEVLRRLGIKPAGGSHSHMKRRITTMGLDVSHFLGQAHNRGQISAAKKTAEEILHNQYDARPKLNQLRRAMHEVGVGLECAKCGLGPIWNDDILCLEIDHINSNWMDNRIENLQYLCPNCHWQVTYLRRIQAASDEFHGTNI